MVAVIHDHNFADGVGDALELVGLEGKGDHRAGLGLAVDGGGGVGNHGRTCQGQGTGGEFPVVGTGSDLVGVEVELCAAGELLAVLGRGGHQLDLGGGHGVVQVDVDGVDTLILELALGCQGPVGAVGGVVELVALDVAVGVLTLLSGGVGEAAEGLGAVQVDDDLVGVALVTGAAAVVGVPDAAEIAVQQIGGGAVTGAVGVVIAVGLGSPAGPVQCRMGGGGGRALLGDADDEFLAALGGSEDLTGALVDDLGGAQLVVGGGEFTADVAVADDDAGAVFGDGNGVVLSSHSLGAQSGAAGQDHSRRQHEGEHPFHGVFHFALFPPFFDHRAKLCVSAVDTPKNVHSQPITSGTQVTASRAV